MGKFQSFNFDNFLEQKFEDCYIRNFFLVKLISKALEEIENDIKKNLNNLNDEKECKEQMQKNIGVYYHVYIEPNINFIILLILSSIESGDYIQFNHNISFEKLKIYLKNASTNINGNFAIFRFIFFSALFPFLSISKRFEKDFKKNYSKDKIEDIYANNIFYKKRIKNIVNSNISSNEVYDLSLNIFLGCNKIQQFSRYSEKQIIGEKYYQNFLELLNNYSDEFFQDIEISIFDNLKEENINRNHNLMAIKEMIYESMNDKESKKGFLALIKQSYLLGKLRSNIVSNYFIIFNI